MRPSTFPICTTATARPSRALTVRPPRRTRSSSTAARKLRYVGRIDDAERASLVKTQDLRAALDAVLAGPGTAGRADEGVRLLGEMGGQAGAGEGVHGQAREGAGDASNSWTPPAGREETTNAGWLQALMGVFSIQYQKTRRMSLEIERKFLVNGDAWRALGEPVLIRQGYLSAVPERIVRVRVAGDRAWITVKGISFGATRLEFEYPIPLKDASDMLDGFCERPVLEKRRTRIPLGGVNWEVDEFLGENAGLIVAEVELRTPDQPLVLPDWIGPEVTGDPRYFNSSLAAHPYARWQPEQ